MRGTLVVGGGVVGLCCAYQLARRGERVQVVDRAEPGAGCSAGNAGWVVPTMAAPLPAPGVPRQALRWLLTPDGPFYLQPARVPGLVPWLWRFLRRCNARDHARGLASVARFGLQTMELFDALAADGVAFEMHRSGILFAFLDRRELLHAREGLEQVARLGYPRPVELDPASARAEEPLLTREVAGALLVEGERHLRPEALVAGLLRRLGQLGVEVRAGLEVLGWRAAGGRVVAALTSEGELRAERFVVAAGAWSARLLRPLGLPLPLIAGKGYSITVLDRRARLRRPVYLEEARIACSPFRGALRLAGTMELTGLDDARDARRLQAMRRGARRYLQGWDEGGEQVEWAGLRPLLPDGLPAIGLVPGYANCAVATGHGMLGVTLAPATAGAVAELLLEGRGAPELGPFDPARFGRGR